MNLPRMVLGEQGYVSLRYSYRLRKSQKHIPDPGDLIGRVHMTCTVTLLSWSSLTGLLTLRLETSKLRFHLTCLSKKKQGKTLTVAKLPQLTPMSGQQIHMWQQLF